MEYFVMTSMLNPLCQCKTAKFYLKDHKCLIKNLKSNMVPKIMRLSSANLVHRFARFLDSVSLWGIFARRFSYGLFVFSFGAGVFTRRFGAALLLICLHISAVLSCSFLSTCCFYVSPQHLYLTANISNICINFGFEYSTL